MVQNPSYMFFFVVIVFCFNEQTFLFFIHYCSIFKRVTMLEIIPPWPKLGQGIQLEMTLHPPLFLHFTLDAHIFAPWKTLHFRCQCNTKQMQNKYKSVYYGFAENHHHHHHHYSLVIPYFMFIIIILITRPTLASYSSLPKGVVPNSIWCHVNGWNIYLTWHPVFRIRGHHSPPSLSLSPSPSVRTLCPLWPFHVIPDVIFSWFHFHLIEFLIANFAIVPCDIFSFGHSFIANCSSWNWAKFSDSLVQN